jgi:hypothetical protein
VPALPLNTLTAGASPLPRHIGRRLRVPADIVSPSRFLRASVAAAIVGLITITIYLVVERAIAEHLSVVLGVQQLLQWDASNGYGPAAFGGGWPMAFIGLAMDFVVSLVWALVFTALYVNAPAVRRNIVMTGLAFGAVVMVVMIYAIVPIGHATRMHSSVSHVINVLVAHTIFFGLPLALTVDALSKAEALRSLESPRIA